VLIFLSFITGLHYGSKIKNNEVIELPNPVRAVKEYKETKKIEEKLDREQQIEEINLANIESYNGTQEGQKDFPNIN
jgi:hypothetical protein